jgi:hypothetical protein
LKSLKLGSVKSKPNKLIANIKFDSLLVCRLIVGGSKSIIFSNEDVMIYLLTVFKPILANNTIKTIKITIDTKPPLAVV